MVSIGRAQRLEQSMQQRLRCAWEHITVIMVRLILISVTLTSVCLGSYYNDYGALKTNLIHRVLLTF